MKDEGHMRFSPGKRLLNNCRHICIQLMRCFIHKRLTNFLKNIRIGITDFVPMNPFRSFDLWAVRSKRIFSQTSCLSPDSLRRRCDNFFSSMMITQVLIISVLSLWVSVREFLYQFWNGFKSYDLNIIVL